MNNILRISVDSGGCSGFQYNYEMINPDNINKDDDIKLIKDNIMIIIDKISLQLIDGSTLEYENDLIRSSFIIKNNPNAIEDCGCGVSFNTDLF